MLKNIIQIISKIISCITITFASYTCYADITATEIFVGCNENPIIIKQRVYPGKPDTQLSLITKGMLVKGTEQLIIDWDNLKSQQHTPDLPEPSILAECVPYFEGKRLLDVDFTYELMWPPNKVLVCKKREGIAISVITPNDVDPNKYRYVATLIVNKDDYKEATTIK
jgi:hypothetical protein